MYQPENNCKTSELTDREGSWGNCIADLQFCLLHDLPVGFRGELAQLEELAGFVVHSNLPVHERELVGSPLLIQRLIGILARSESYIF